MLVHYGDKFYSTYLQNYTHWDSGEVTIDFSVEESKLANHVSQLPPDTEITLVAKSAGSLLALLAIGHNTVIPTQCIFFGVPLDLAAGGIFYSQWTVLSSFKIPTMAFHNVPDPTTSYDFTKTTLEKYAPQIHFITTKETDHWYGDFPTYDKYLLHMNK